MISLIWVLYFDSIALMIAFEVLSDFSLLWFPRFYNCSSVTSNLRWDSNRSLL